MKVHKVGCPRRKCHNKRSLSLLDWKAETGAPGVGGIEKGFILRRYRPAQKSALSIVLSEARFRKTQEVDEKIVLQLRSRFNMLTDNKLQWRVGINNTLCKCKVDDKYMDPDPSTLEQEPSATRTDLATEKGQHDVNKFNRPVIWSDTLESTIHDREETRWERSARELLIRTAVLPDPTSLFDGTRACWRNSLWSASNWALVNGIDSAEEWLSTETIALAWRSGFQSKACHEFSSKNQCCD